MKLIKFALLSLVVLFLVLTGLSLLLPANLRVTRVINVTVSKQKVYSAVSDFSAWKQWNKFMSPNTLTNVHFSFPPAGKGAMLAADELTIREVAADSDGILLHWSLKGGKEVEGGFRFGSLSPSQRRDGLTVLWYFDLHFRWYPWEKLGVFVYDRKLGPIMEESLTGLKQFVENSR